MDRPLPARSPWRTGLLAAVLTATALAAGACSDETPKGAGPTAGLGEVEKVVVGTRVPGKELALRVGPATTKAKTARISTTTTQSGAGRSRSAGEGVIRIEGKQSLTQLSTTLDGTATQVVIGPSGIYLGGMRKVDGKSWLRISLTGDDAPSKAIADSLTRLSASSDPALLATRWGGVEAFVVTAHTAINGTAVTTYEATQTGASLTAQVPASLRSSLRKITVVTRLYVSADDLPVRVVSRVSGTLKGANFRQTTTVNYSDWGAPVSLTLPKASEVLDMRDLTAMPKGLL